MKSLSFRTRGAGLLELMLVLMIIGIILFMVIRYFNISDENLRVTEAETMINNIVKASYQWVQSYPNFKGDTASGQVSMEKLVAADLLPKNYISAYNKTGISPWNTYFAICPSPTDASYIRIEMYAIPYASCENLREKLKPYAKEQPQCTAFATQLSCPITNNALPLGTTIFTGTF